MKYFTNIKKIIFLIVLFTFSCNQQTTENENMEDITTEITFQNLSFMTSDSLNFKIIYSNPNDFNASLIFKDGEEILSKTELIQDSTLTTYHKIYHSNDMKSISARITHPKIDKEVFSFDIPKLINQNIAIVSDNKSIFKNELIDNKLFNIKEERVNSFKKYDFTDSDILILENINFFSNYLIEAIQKFLLSKKLVIVFMAPNMNQSTFLSQTLSFPEIKAIRGTSKNQYFEILGELPNQYTLENNSENKIFKFIDIKNYDIDNINYYLSTNDPLIIKKNIMGANTIFFTTLLKEDWVNDSFNNFAKNIFLDFIYDEIVVDENS